MKLNCVITDDEPIAQNIIEDYVNMVPGLRVLARCQDAMETLSVLHNNQVDVLFIDIQMPEINGLDFIRSLKKPPMVIFTTAYPSHAIDGFELDAIDYLVKPVSLERFLKAADKIFARSGMLETGPALHASPPNPEPSKKYFFIRSNPGFIKIEYNKILYIEGLENYIRIICEDKTVISLNTMKTTENMLPSGFIRIHRSFIINLDKVDALHDNTFKIHDKSLVIGKSYRKIVLDLIKNAPQNQT
jgi:DNA-binding LytR/AlgR family response regulator